MDNPQELIILENITNVLEQLDIAYAIGGSMASSIYGRVRFTQDADITVEPFENRAEKLFELIKPEFYISKDAMYQALRQRSSFNVVHDVVPIAVGSLLATPIIHSLSHL